MCRFKQQEAERFLVDGGLKQSLLAEGAGSGKACPLAKDSRLPVDRLRPPGADALLCRHVFLPGWADVSR